MISSALDGKSLLLPQFEISMFPTDVLSGSACYGVARFFGFVSGVPVVLI